MKLSLTYVFISFLIICLSFLMFSTEARDADSDGMDDAVDPDDDNDGILDIDDPDDDNDGILDLGKDGDHAIIFQFIFPVKMMMTGLAMMKCRKMIVRDCV